MIIWLTQHCSLFLAATQIPLNVCTVEHIIANKCLKRERVLKYVRV